MQLAVRISKPGWINQTDRKTEFALCFLETDLMLRRTGYLKRHMINRISEVALKPEQTERAVALLYKSVLQVTGREEFRAYCKLAARLCPPGLQAMLLELSKTVKLAPKDVQRQLRKVTRQLSADEFRTFYSGQATIDYTLSQLLPPMPTHERQSKSQMIARDAWRMQTVIESHRMSTPGPHLPIRRYGQSLSPARGAKHVT